MVVRELDTLKACIEYFKSKIQKKEKSQEEKEEEIGNFSMNEGKADKVFGFRREIVKGVVIFFGSVLMLAFIFASSDAEEKTEKVEEMPVVSEAEIASPKKAKNELPNDYETLIAMNQAKEAELKRQAEENARKAEQMQKEQEAAARAVAEVNEMQAQQPLPAIPNNQTQVLPVTFEQMPQISEETVSAEKLKKEKEKEEKYKSAITFSVSDKSNEEKGDETSEKQTKTTMQVKSAYVAPNNSTLGAGTVIPVRLLTGINTDVEGQVMVQVLADVYDTATGTKLLIPQGSRLTGKYEKKAVANGRVPITFEQLTLPNGGYWTIGENIVAIDGAGYTGIAGKVHHHTGQKVSAGAIGSAVAALGSLAAGNVSSQNTYSAGQIAAQGAMANLINTTSNLMNQATDIENTVTVEPGYEFNVYVTKNITF